MAGNRYMCLGGYAVNIIIASVSGVGSEGGVRQRFEGCWSLMVVS